MPSLAPDTVPAGCDALRLVYCLDSLGTGGSERSLVEYLPTFKRENVLLTIVCTQHREEGLEASAVAAGVDVRFLDPGPVPRVRHLRRLLKKLRPHVLHTTHFTCDVTGRLAAIGLGIPVMNSLVNTTYDASRRADPRVRRSRFEAVRAVDAVTGRLLCDHFHAVSSSAKRDAVENLHIPSDRITVIHRGRNVDRLGVWSARRRNAIRKSLGFGKGAELLLQVGRQEFQKNHLASVAAFAEVAALRPNVHLLLAGRTGHETPAIEAAIASSGAADRVHRLGHRSDIPDLLCAADVFLFPSHYEGLPGAVLEAMALRVPIASSDVSPVLDALGAGETALVCAPNDVRALALNVGRLLDDKALRERITTAAVERFTAEFDITTAAGRMVSLYRTVAAR